MPVSAIVAQRSAYLTLDELTADPVLARRLPSELAWRFHALPLAEDNGRVTVAMADPDDAEAREAVVAVLGPRSCVVRGSPLAIDARLTEIWGYEAAGHLRVGICGFPRHPQGEHWDYARAFGALLGAHINHPTATAEVDDLPQEEELVCCDLMFFLDPSHPLIRRLLTRSPTASAQASAQNAAPFGILVAQRPRWPLRSILLAICGDSADDAAVNWAVRLARPSSATVTALAVVPPVPAMYRGLSRMEQSVAALLSTDTTLGRQMHRVARCLAEGKVDGTVRLRQGAPDHQICREAFERDHDIVIMATRPCHWLWRQIRGDPICSLLSRLDRPVLLAEPTTA